ncbi:MAG: hypothetical protein U0R24_12080 [Solirubrobacterales bacterium]
MTTASADRGTSWLREGAASGSLHTIRLAWSDRLGGWRGKRLPVERFIDSPDARMGFCDGMIVVDVNCDVIEATPFSNFSTGYPDMYLRPRPETIGPVGWAPGEAFVLGTLEDHAGNPLEVAPAHVLERVLARLTEAGATVSASLTLSGRLMLTPTEPVPLLPDGKPLDATAAPVLTLAADGLVESGVPVRSVAAERDGTFEISLGALPATAAAEASVMSKAALKELATLAGQQATFMTRMPDLERPSTLRMDVALEGAGDLDEPGLASTTAAVRGLLQPSVNAFKAGPPQVARTDGGFRLTASSEADPFTAIAASLAAAWVSLDAGAAVAAAGSSGAPTLDAAVDDLAAADWAGEWLGERFLENAIPLLRNELELFSEAVTDWELDRYWSAS